MQSATRADLAALGRLWERMMRDHERYSPSFALSDDALWAWQEATLELMGRHDAFVFLAAEQGHPVGFCSGFVAYNPPIYETRALGLVSELVVARAARGRGVGTALLTAARRFFAARDLAEFQLSTAVANRRARRFWRQHGGEPLLVRYRFATF